MTAKKTKAQKALDKLYDDAFERLGSRIQFNMFDLSKIRDESILEFQSGKSMNEAVTAVIAKYRQT